MGLKLESWLGVEGAKSLVLEMLVNIFLLVYGVCETLFCPATIKMLILNCTVIYVYYYVHGVAGLEMLGRKLAGHVFGNVGRNVGEYFSAMRFQHVYSKKLDLSFGCLF